MDPGTVRASAPVPHSPAILAVVLMLLAAAAGALLLYKFKSAPKEIVFGSSRSKVKLLSHAPKVLFIKDFVDEAAAHALIDTATPRLARSSVQGADGNTTSDYRTSFTTNFKKSETPEVRALEALACQYAGVRMEQLEPLQFLRYEPGQYYKPHYDFFVPDAPGTPRELTKGGQRTHSFFVYLNDVLRGGHTAFPRLKIKVKPQRGCALFWHNTMPSGEPDYNTFHGGEPPKRGVKYAINIWIREGAYDPHGTPQPDNQTSFAK